MHHPPQFPARYRVHSHSGLVQQQQPGPAEQRASQPQFLFHAAREFARQPPREAVEIGEGQQPRENRLAFRPHHPPEVRVQFQVLPHGKVFIEPEPLGHVTDELAQLGGLADGVQSVDLDAARRRRQQPGHQPHERSLARPIRPHQARNHPRLHWRGNIRQRRPPRPRKHLPHILQMDDGLGHETVTGMPWRRPSSELVTTTRRR